MCSEIAIKVENLSKCYQIYNHPRDRLRQFILPRLQQMAGRIPQKYYQEFWALQNVSFEIKKGETIGIIGRNGSGKSTLLQLICGTLNPTSGSIQMNGRVAALLELGSGFNPEFTGRENVQMSCSLLGLSPAETDAHFERIAAFADIGDFIEQPVKTYSSGMYVRLAFAANIISQPDIMVVDEALAVGDMNFQAKCMTALRRIQESGATVLFVSHDISAVKSLCSRALYLEHGELMKIGSASYISTYYTQIMRKEMNQEIDLFGKASSGFKPIAIDSSIPQKIDNPIIFKKDASFEHRVKQFRYGSGGARITFAELLDTSGQPIKLAGFGQAVCINIYFETDIEAELTCNYYVADENKNFLIGCDPRLAGDGYLISKKSGKYLVTYHTTLPLKAGNYSIDLELAKPIILDECGEFLDVISNAIVFNIARRPESQLWASLYVKNECYCYEL